MTSLDKSEFIFERYPEENPFSMHPQPYNLRPGPLDHTGDTPEFRAVCCEIARNSGRNPLMGTYGSSPLMVECKELLEADMPLVKYERPPPLQKASLQAEILFVEHLNPEGTTPLFKVLISEKEYVLKVYTDMGTPQEGSEKRSAASGSPLQRFTRDAEVYAHLRHYGACDAGAALQCHGWLELSRANVSAIAQLPSLSPRWRTIAHNRDTAPPKALLLEYIPGAVPVDRAVIGFHSAVDITTAALDALARIHGAYVLHGAVDGSHLLAHPTEPRVVWTNFDKACPVGCAPADRPIRRQELYQELARGWALFYEEILPDARIGYIRESA